MPDEFRLRIYRPNALSYSEDQATPRAYFDVLGTVGIPAFHPGGRTPTRALASEFKAWGARLVLEVGCGTGVSLCRMAAWMPEAHLVGVDLSLPMLRSAARRVRGKRLGARVSLVRGDVHRLPFRGEAFDAVYDESVLVTVCAEEALREIRWVLKPGGLLGDVEYCWLGEPDGRLVEAVERLTGVRFVVRTGEEWVGLVERSGFRLRAKALKKQPRLQPLDVLEAEGLLGLLKLAKRYLSAEPDFRRVLRRELSLIGRCKSLGYGTYTYLKS